MRLGRVKLPNCKGLNRWGYLFDDKFEDKHGTLYKTNDLLVNGFYTGCWVLSNALVIDGNVFGVDGCVGGTGSCMRE